MVTPFKVTFRQRNRDSHMVEDMPVTKFVTNEEEAYQLIDSGDILTTVENMRLEVEFESDNKNARFYMDGLDTISMNHLEVDETDQVYLSAAQKTLTLFDVNTDRGGDSFYPFIPGYYRIRVVYDNTSYFSWMKVTTKQMSESQWERMKEDIETTLHGLAQDLIRKNASLGLQSHYPIPFHILRKLYILKNAFQKWVYAINKIESEPRFRVGKSYNLVHEGKNTMIDNVGIRYRLRHPESKDYIYSPQHTKNYNLSENQLIKYIMRYIVRETYELNNYLQKHISKVEKEIASEKKIHYHSLDHVQVRSKEMVLNELKDYVTLVGRIRNNCLKLLRTEWMEEVEEKRPVMIPQAIHLDMTYRQVYQVYRAMKNEEISVSLDSNYNFYWKRTDLLYEIWGFLQIINALKDEKIGFEVVNGWIFDMDASNKTIEVPFLEPGTCIEFKRENIKISLIYDKQVPYSPGNTSLLNPLYATANNNRPDAILNFYDEDKNEFIGSIVLDFKYRPLNGIWNPHKIYTGDKTDTMRQLLAYKDNFNSQFTYRIKRPNWWRRVRPIHEVWAVYPKHEANRELSQNPYDNFQTRLTELTPMDDNHLFSQQLSKSIEEVITMYNED